MALQAVPQLALDERTIDDAELEDVLERRETAKAKVARARKAAAELDEEAKTRIRGHEIGEAPVRVGRFRVAARTVAPRMVAFETSPSTRITIALVKDDEQ